MAFFKRLLRDEGAQDLAEYAVALTVIGAGAAIAAMAFAGNVKAIWSVTASVAAAAVAAA